MEWLKTILAEHVDAEKLDEVIEKYNKEAPKHTMPKDKFNEVNEELKATRAQLTETKTAFEGLKEKAESVEDYEKRVAELDEKLKTTETEAQKKIAQITKQSKFKEKLMKSKAHDDAIDLLLEKYSESVEIGEDGELTNADEILEKMKSERAGLFKEVVSESVEKDANREVKHDKAPKDMTPDEYAKYFQERESNRTKF